MPGKLKPYPGYSSCNLPWIKEIPSEWNLLKAKNVFDPIDIRSETGQEELLSVSEKHGVTPRKNVNVTMFKAESYEGYKMCWPGDLVINSLWAWMQGLGFSRHHGIISSAYGVYRLKSGLSSDFKFFDYLLKSNAYLWELRVNSKGIWRSRYQLTDESFFSIPIIIPPEKDRKQIICYLDWKTSQINRFIKAKKRLIELLKEQKQVIINDAVTGKIDVRTGKPYPKYKNSGMEWLGVVPEGWDHTRLRRVCKVYSGGTPSKEIEAYWKDGTIPWLASGEVNKRKIFQSETFITEEGYRKSSAKWIPPKSLIIALAGQGKTKGMVATIEIQMTGNQSLAAIIPRNNLMNYEFLGLYLEAKYKMIRGMVGDDIRDGLNLEHIKSIPIPILPIHIQEQIVKYLNINNSSFEKSIKKIQAEIQLLLEFRSRLIADVVTGKVDVRNININAKDASDAMDEGVEEEAEINEIPESET